MTINYAFKIKEINFNISQGCHRYLLPFCAGIHNFLATIYIVLAIVQFACLHRIQIEWHWVAVFFFDLISRKVVMTTFSTLFHSSYSYTTASQD